MEGKILVVDDEESLARLISFNLQKEGFKVTVARDGLQAWERIKTEKPDLIILDIMLPGKDGLEICRDLRQYGMRIPVIMLSARDEEIDRVLGLEIGANDYVTKPFSTKELVARTKAHLRRYREDLQDFKAEDEVQIGSFRINRKKWEIFFKDELLFLTVKEYELLDLLLCSRGRVLTREYLMDALYSHSDNVNTRVLDVHIGKIRSKIERDTQNPQYIKTVRGLGYKYGESEPD